MLTEPVVLAGRVATSRVVFGPHETNLCNRRSLSPKSVAYYERRARGGAGIVVTEYASVGPDDWPYERAPLATECVTGWRDSAAACHAHGTLLLAGLSHNGSQGSTAYSRSILYAPSRVPDPGSRELPSEMQPADIATVVSGFAEAAALAAGAGVDGVELDAGATGLLRQFHSGLTNERTDTFGTDRLRFTREVIAGVRAAIGSDRILALRLSCDELAPWAGITPESAAEDAAALADSIDLLTVVRGGALHLAAYRPDAHMPPGFNRDLSRTIRSRVAGRVPIVLQGSMIDAESAQQALDDGVADLVEMTRAQIADPDLVRKVRSGHRPRPCVLCNQACLVRDVRNPLVGCIGNPDAGHEMDRPPVPQEQSGAALVVGGGAAGLEAARVLAERGHPVTLRERSNRLGGMARAAAVGESRTMLARLTDWLANECHSLGVRIELDAEVGADDIDAARRAGETVIVATGSRDAPTRYRVDPPVRLLTAPMVLVGAQLPAGPVLLDDPIGGPIAVALAEWLAARGHEVAIATGDRLVGSQLAMTGDLVGANHRLQRAGVARHLGVVIRSAGADGTMLEDVFTGEQFGVACATLVDCGHRVPDDALWRARPETVRIGDCVAPRTLAEAIREGRAAALATRPASTATATSVGGLEV
ncbi:mycofactocin system FadH/OYE family oxidoreductase 1 [Aldersonia sp. NBC_00410]|uniref:mycofactocin system FadH/OYE family oxidoreductase 1 n=1 Tax=Aldersonia sp. NBC_00410 TaxID=2975954 RepID=UPI00225358A6|nr:mycofactocin system FadH/OYE family oxidoreductase 1 [Aldersonia sp. NBC_00410]MCX5041596.1 mycofactocin system FadH/OYE family oxidoreductase 1 [Aldersonia sp. NBC_00410]